MRPLLALSLFLALPAFAQAPEDEAHRADRERTEALNRQVAQAVARRDAGNGTAKANYAEARALYEKQMAAWRAQVAACQRGDYSACQR